jgi:hypothetical protein
MQALATLRDLCLLRPAGASYLAYLSLSLSLSPLLIFIASLL